MINKESVHKKAEVYASTYIGFDDVFEFERVEESFYSGAMWMKTQMESLFVGYNEWRSIILSAYFDELSGSFDDMEPPSEKELVKQFLKQKEDE